MTKMNWDRARRDRLPKQLDEWRCPYLHRRRPAPKPRTTIAGPIYITDGRNADGTLVVHTFATAQDAWSAGYEWAGRVASR